MTHAHLLITGVTLAPVPFQLVPQVQITQVGIQGRRARIDMAERLLYHMQRGAFFYQFGAARAAAISLLVTGRRGHGARTARRGAVRGVRRVERRAGTRKHMHVLVPACGSGSNRC